MFRALSDEENLQVKRWQAPQLGPSTALPLENVEQTLRRIEAGRGVLGASEPSPPPVEASDPLPVEELAALRETHRQSLKQVREEAYAAGFAEGNVKARAALSQELAPLRHSLTSQARVLERNALEQLVQLACDMASLVLQQEVSLHPEKLLHFVERALAAMPELDAPVSVRVHPQDHRLLADAFDGDARVTLQEDASLARGDCRLTQGRSHLDTGFSGLLEQMAAELAAGLQTVPADAADGQPVDDPA